MSSRVAPNMMPQSFLPALTDHLASWGLKRFTSDAEYFAWQRQELSPDQLDTLHQCVERRRHGSSADDVAFYDATAHPAILPVLYSQRYDYYQAVGPRVAARVADARTILDFGCGVGILTSFYARQFSDTCVLGIDRSPASIARAQEQAKALGIDNVVFQCLDLSAQQRAGVFDLIVATHALVQAESDPGLPSRNWMTFERAHDALQQREFEARTGIGPRLDQLVAMLPADGRMIVFEKTRQLSRRVPVQRALAARALHVIEQPELVNYALVEEAADDGPFYMLRKGCDGAVGWDEAPEPDDGPSFDRTVKPAFAPARGAPLYENHRPSAQGAWEQLTNRQVRQEMTRDDAERRQLHVEIGSAAEGAYLYCSHTFDQRQLVVMRHEDRDELDAYYADIVAQTA